MKRFLAPRPAPVPRMIARAECRYRAVDLHGVPSRHKSRALEAQLIAWAPFPSASFAIALRGDHAMVYAWPQDAGRDWPESFHCELPQQSDALRIVQCMRGAEGQYWSEGILRASRWWPTLPSHAEWQNFQRGAQVKEGLWQETSPEPLPTPSLQRPALPLRTLEELRAAAAVREHATVAILGFVLAIAASWQIGQWVALDDAHEQITRELARLQEVTTPLEKARDEAITNAVQARGLAQALEGPDPARILQHLAQHLPSPGVIAREIEIHRNELSLALEVPDLNRRLDYLQALERGGWLQNVVEQRGAAGLLNLKMNLGEGQPPTAAATADQPPASAQ